MADFEIRNFRGLQITEDVHAGIEQALYKGGSHILNESNKIAPKDEGPLTQTSDIDVDVENGKVNIFYTQKYAAEMHENPQFNFQGGREGKFLEQVILRDVSRVREILVNEIKGRMGG